MKLVGQARLHQTNVKTQRQLRHKEPIELWEDMKNKLKEKYVLSSYHSKLMDQWNTLRQGNSFVVKYIEKFEGFILRCQIVEDPMATLSRFKLGLTPEFKKELIPNPHADLNETHRLVKEFEKYLRPQTLHQFEPYRSDSRTGVPPRQPRIEGNYSWFIYHSENQTAIG